jgi:hypothetical protein
LRLVVSTHIGREPLPVPLAPIQRRVVQFKAMLALSWLVGLPLFVLIGFIIIAHVAHDSEMVITAVKGARKRFLPTPPKMRFKSTGGSISRIRNERTGAVTWNSVRPSFSIHNIGSKTVYDIHAGILDPRGTERISHPNTVSALAEARGPMLFGSTDQFRVPNSWLAGYDGDEPQTRVLYFVTVDDEDHRTWDARCRSVAGKWVRLHFRRVKG